MHQLAVRIGATLCLLFACGRVLAIEPHQEYRKRVESSQNISALTDGLFGDTVNLYNGQTTFSEVDISLPGNNALPVQFGRSFNVQILPSGPSGGWDTSLGGVGGWDVDVPYIAGTFGPVTGWSDQRCSTTWVPNVATGFQLTEIWQGNSINIPGQASRTMLAVEANTPVPTDGTQYKITTSQRDVFDCVPMQSGLAGEGYRMKTTSGLRYTFDIAVQRYGGTMTRNLGGQIASQTSRTRVYLLASKIEDRFGNAVYYQYNETGHPTRIWSTDGREINLTYTNGQLSTATAAGRTWTYQYISVEGYTRLSAVVRPDESSWKFAYANALRPMDQSWDGNSDSRCMEQPPELPADFTFTITHPSNAVGTFTFANSRHYRSGVHVSECLRRTSSADWGTTQYWVLNTPYFFDVMSISQKTLSGPGLASRSWGYTYGGGGQSLWGNVGSPAVYPCSTCATEKYVTVSNPDGTSTRYKYGFLYALNEGRVLGVETLDSAASVVRAESTTYLSESEASGQNFFGRYGLIYNGDDPSTARVRPATRKTILQDDVTFASQVDKGCGGLEIFCFDTFANPTSETKLGPLESKVDGTEYHHDTTQWVLGQVKRTTTNGVEVDRTTYHATTALPLNVARFGKLQQTLTYNTDGTIATVSDGRDGVGGDETTITLSNWKRGVPQTIKYPVTPESPTGAIQSVVVNDDGTIASVTDENGNKTCYGYDEMGRLANIIYPSEASAGVCDTSTWAQTSQVFQQVAAIEYGLPANHWKQVVSTGNARKIVYFDAMWRPVVEESFDNTNASDTRSLTVKRYDLGGHLAFQSYPVTSSTNYADAALKGTRTAYDALDRVTQVEQDSELGVLSTTTSYQSDASGPYTLVTNPRDKQTRTWFQVFDQPDYNRPVTIWHPEGVYTHITRDVFGKPTRLLRSNSSSPTGGTIALKRDYTYNSHQELCRTDEPETGSTYMGYDLAGNLGWSASGQTVATACDVSSVPADQVVTRTYDQRNRIKTLTFPDGRGNQTWNYVPDGLPSQIVTNNSAGGNVAVNTYNYNRRRLLVGETLTIGPQLWGVGYDYNSNGHVAGHVYPSGLSVDYAPNALGQATRAGTFASGASYFPNGAIKQFTYGNGVVHTLTQNARGLPERSRDATATVVVHDDSLDFDRNGNVAAISDGVGGTRGNRDMTYDDLDRLIGVVSPMFGTASYAYNALDDLKSVVVTAGSKIRNHGYIYDQSNRLTNVTDAGGASVIGLGYDSRGNLENKNGQLYDFDLGNRLRQAMGLEQYLYDGHGRRVQAIRPGQGSIFSFYGQDGVLRFQRKEREGKSTDYVQLAGSLVAEVEQVLPLSVPTITAPSYSSNGAYTVSWTAVSLASKYQLQERLGSGVWVTVHDGPGTSKVFSGKPAGAYSYQARACHASGCGAWSAAALTIVELPPKDAPTVSAPAIGTSGNYTVAWASVATASDYHLEESANGGSWTEVQSGSSLSKVYTGKAAGQYAYRAKACNPAGCGPVSAAVTVQALYPAEGVPVLTAPATNTTGSFVVSWTVISEASIYRLEEQVDGGGWVQVQDSATNSRSLSGKSAGNYGYRVRACNAAGCSAYSNIGSTQVIFAPASAPTISVPVSSATGAYAVSWSAVPTATTYKLEEQPAGGLWVEVQNGESSSFSTGGKTNGTYGYRVRACNIAGCSAYSPTGSIVVTLPPSGAPSLTVPASSSSGSYTVSWTTVSTATSYKLEEQVGDGAWTQVQDATGTSRAITGKSSGTYGYRVRACNAGGCGGYSATSSVAVTLPPAGAPSLTVPTSSLTGSYTVSWTTVPATTRYELEERVDSGPWVRIHEDATASKALSAKTTGTWGYQVRACNGGGCGPFSAIASIAVTRPPTSAPTLSVPATSTSSSYTLSWTSVAAAARYEVQERFNGGGWTLVIDAAGTAATVSGKTTGTWEYQSRACNAAGCGPYSGTAVTVVTLPPTTPSITSSVKTQWIVSGRTQIQCSVSWTSVIGAERYELQAYGGVLQYSGSLTSVTGSKNTSTYCAASQIVRACNVAGCSAWSSPPYTQQVQTIDMDNPL